jgi:hypothetical protein
MPGYMFVSKGKENIPPEDALRKLEAKLGEDGQ